LWERRHPLLGETRSDPTEGSDKKNDEVFVADDNRAGGDGSAEERLDHLIKSLTKDKCEDPLVKDLTSFPKMRRAGAVDLVNSLSDSSSVELVSSSAAEGGGSESEPATSKKDTNLNVNNNTLKKDHRA
jgi:hypothetical protein